MYEGPRPDGRRATPRILFAGDGGSGKTAAMIFAFLYWHVIHVEHFGVKEMPPSVILVETIPLMMDRIVKPAMRDWGDWWKFTSGGSKEGRALTFHDRRYGSISLMYANEIDRLRGMEFGAVGIEELSTLPPEQNGEFILDLLEYPLRMSKGCVSQPIVASSNWDGPGQGWMRRCWWPEDVRPDANGKIYGRDPDVFKYFAFKLHDHPDQVYAQEQINKMEAYTGALRESRLLGRPSLPTGSAFPTWNKDVCTFRFKDRFPHGIPRHWRRFIGLDWGIADPYAAIWFAIDEEGDFWVYREDYAKNLADVDQAKRLIGLTSLNEQIEAVYYDPSMDASRRSWNDLSHSPPVSRAYKTLLGRDARFGAMLPGDNSSRTNMWRTLGSLIQRNPLAYYPNIHICEDCANLIMEIETAKWHSVGGVYKEDLDPRVPDHALTALMYGILRTLFQKSDTSVLSIEEQISLIKADDYSYRPDYSSTDDSPKPSI